MRRLFFPILALCACLVLTLPGCKNVNPSDDRCQGSGSYRVLSIAYF